MKSVASTALFVVVAVGSGCAETTGAEAARDSPLPTLGWSHAAGDPGSLRHSPLSDLTPENVDGLRPAWSWSTGERPMTASRTGEAVTPGKFEATPLAFGDTLFLSTPYNRVVALDGRSGAELWAFDPGAADWGPIGEDRAGFVHRGVASWAGPDGRRILIASRWELIALDAATGNPIAGFGDAGRVDLAADLRWPVDGRLLGNTSPPVVWEDIVLVGSAVADRIVFDRDPPGAVQAFDVRTGRRLWRWDPVPPEGTAERATWGGESAGVSGHVNVWTGMSVDPERGLLYAPVSAASNDYYGGRRPGDNLYTQSLVCIDIRTGTLVWYRQLVHHDLWDYDLPSPPALVPFRRNGQAVDAVLLATKMGYLYAFDRLSGEALWPIEERPAPPSEVPGEVASPTQPHATWPPPFTPQGFTRDDVVDFTPGIEAQALEMLEGRRLGSIFTPPSLEGTVVRPGWVGGAGWGSTAIDPERGLAFVKGTNQPVLIRLTPTGDRREFVRDSLTPDPTRPLVLEIPAGRRWGILRHDALRIPIVKPPYGTLTAYEIPSGEIRWSITLGDTPEIREHPLLRSLDLPPLGVAGSPGGLSTGSGLVFIAGGGKDLFAIDALNGRVLWSAPLGRDGEGNPMTYRASDGRQYVVVATGSRDAARLQAFAIPF